MFGCNSPQLMQLCSHSCTQCRVATAGKLVPPPPPQPPIGHPVRSMQIRGDFHVGKMGVSLQVWSHVLNAPTLRRTFFGLTLTKKDEVVEVVEVGSYFGRSSVKLGVPL